MNGMEKQLTLTRASFIDIDAIMSIIDEARQFMKSQLSGQWQDGTPRRSTILDDIAQQRFFVARLKDRIVGCFALLDDEPGYQHLLRGQWRQDGPYLVIHRFATHRDCFGQGIASYMLAQIEVMAKHRQINIIRVDTHVRNIPMLNLLVKHGYIRCGSTLIEKNKLRDVFEKLLTA